LAVKTRDLADAVNTQNIVAPLSVFLFRAVHHECHVWGVIVISQCTSRFAFLFVSEIIAREKTKGQKDMRLLASFQSSLPLLLAFLGNINTDNNNSILVSAAAVTSSNTQKRDSLAVLVPGSGAKSIGLVPPSERDNIQPPPLLTTEPGEGDLGPSEEYSAGTPWEGLDPYANPPPGGPGALGRYPRPEPSRGSRPPVVVVAAAVGRRAGGEREKGY